MRTDLFDYPLPPQLIAQEPAPIRDASRLLVLRRDTDTLEHRHFHELPELLSPNDLLVLNDTRVVPARLLGHRTRTGGKWEGLFLRVTSDGLWEMMCQTRGRLTRDETIALEPGGMILHLVDQTPDGRWLVRPQDTGNPWDLLHRHGHIPLPPYVRKGRAAEADIERYQTVYARNSGAIAAPTAGLHFTPEVFARLKERGISWTFVTLHVGEGTFKPMSAEVVEDHRMHAEWGQLSEESAAALRACRLRGGRIVAIGTTSVRVLETVAAQGALEPWSGDTTLFISPPYPFQAVDALVTNFHLPRSSLLCLVSAFAGIEPIRHAYNVAIKHAYRFYSYGDAMLIV